MAAASDSSMTSSTAPARTTTPPPSTHAVADFTPERFRTIVRPLPDTPSRLAYPPPEKRPEWWDSTHRLLNKMAIANQEGPVSREDLSRITGLAQHLIERGNPKEMLMFMKLLSEFVFIETKGIFFRVLGALCKLTPEINQFFREVPSDESDEGPGLSPLAINTIFRFFEEEYAYPSGLLSCQRLSDLPALTERMIGTEGDHMRGWVVCNDIEDYDPHVVPVFAIKAEGKTHLFIFDSLGHLIAREPSLTRISTALEQLIKHFGPMDIGDRLVIYSYKMKRQNSANGCATFSILDLKNLLERHLRGAGNIIDFYASQEAPHLPHLITRFVAEGSSMPIYELDTLPPEMMKVTQSYRKIGEYEDRPPTLSGDQIPSFERYTYMGDTDARPQTLASFHDRVLQVRRVAPNGCERNLYVDEKRLSDIVHLLARFYKVSVEVESNPASTRVLFPVSESDKKMSDDS
jgi:hypothetical protein